MTQKDDKKKDLKQDPGQADTPLPPDPETLHKTDPQENMKGPISSTMHKIEETMEKEGGKTPDEDE